MTKERFRNDDDLQKAGYVGVDVDVVEDHLSASKREAFMSLLSEDADFGSGYRLFVSPDGKEAVVVPISSSWQNQINVINFELDKPIVPTMKVVLRNLHLN